MCISDVLTFFSFLPYGHFTMKLLNKKKICKLIKNVRRYLIKTTITSRENFNKKNWYSLGSHHTNFFFCKGMAKEWQSSVCNALHVIEMLHYCWYPSSKWNFTTKKLPIFNQNTTKTISEHFYFLSYDIGVVKKNNKKLRHHHLYMNIQKKINIRIK